MRISQSHRSDLSSILDFLSTFIYFDSTAAADLFLAAVSLFILLMVPNRTVVVTTFPSEPTKIK